VEISIPYRLSDAALGVDGLASWISIMDNKVDAKQQLCDYQLPIRQEG
jgi:hypothetical protein